MSKIFVLIILCSGLIACNKNEYKSTKIIGVWKSYKITRDFGSYSEDITNLYSLQYVFGDSIVNTLGFSACEYSTIFDIDTTTKTKYYRLSGEGNILELKNNLVNDDFSSIGISKLTNNSLTIVRTANPNTNYEVTYIEKYKKE